MGVRVYRNEDEKIREYGEVLKFWSNGLGELHDPGKGADIAYNELPEELKRVYDELYWEPTGGASLRYFVETDKGYGIALLNEYDTVTAESSRMDFGRLFETVVEDARNIGLDPAFEKCEVFAGECLGFDGCHEIVVVVPWDTPASEYAQMSKKLDELVYVGCGINAQRKDAAQGFGTATRQEPELRSGCSRAQPCGASRKEEFGIREGIAVGDDLDSAASGTGRSSAAPVRVIGEEEMSLEEKLGNATAESVRMVTEAVVGVGEFVEDSEMKRGLNKAAILRSKTLEACNKIPGYEKLAREEKNQLYDLVKKAVERDMGFDREFVK